MQARGLAISNRAILSSDVIIGKDAVTPNPDCVLGVVSDVIFDPLLGIVLGFVLDDPGWHDRARVIPWAGLQSVSAGRVVALSPSMVVRAGDLYSIRRVLDSAPLRTGTAVRDADGVCLGLFHSVYFNPGTGRIRGLGLRLHPDDPETFFRQASHVLRIEHETLIIPSAPAPGPNGVWSFRLASARLQIRAHNHNPTTPY